jgi:sarcosine oxidase
MITLRMGQPHRVLVVGAGAFGAWTALYLQRAGVQVTLVDAWGPGNARASSGGETRLIRTIYGSTHTYVEMAARALVLWRDWDSAIGGRFYRRTGVLWLTGRDDSYVRESLPALQTLGLPFEHLDPGEAAARWPHVNFEGVRDVYLEPEGGYLLASRACEAVVRELVRTGGTYRHASVSSISADGVAPDVRLHDDERLKADRYVFACGPWLGHLFPDVIGQRVRPTRQEIFYLGTPAGNDRFLEPRMPAWVDLGDRFMYGIPGSQYRGFKVADDTRGPDFDPTSGNRMPTEEGARIVRGFVAHRFPALREEPVLGAEVCQYENSPDGHFIIDRHPAMADVWIAGGGSGHGFKMGPAVGDMLARLVREDGVPDALFALARLLPQGAR